MRGASQQRTNATTQQHKVSQQPLQPAVITAAHLHLAVEASSAAKCRMQGVVQGWRRAHQQLFSVDIYALSESR